MLRGMFPVPWLCLERKDGRMLAWTKHCNWMLWPGGNNCSCGQCGCGARRGGAERSAAGLADGHLQNSSSLYWSSCRARPVVLLHKQRTDVMVFLNLFPWNLLPRSLSYSSRFHFRRRDNVRRERKPNKVSIMSQELPKLNVLLFA